MRPYFTFPNNFEALYAYFHSPEAEVLAGPIAGLPRPICRKIFTANQAHMARPHAHMTLSAPQTAFLDREQWCEAIDIAFAAFGIDTAMIPWFSCRHRDANCDHIHVAARLSTWTGIPVELPPMKPACDRAERDLRMTFAGRIRGITAPPIEKPKPPPMFPRRPRIRGGPYEDVLVEIETVIRRRLPTCFEDLATTLQNSSPPIRLTETPTIYGRAGYQVTRGTRKPVFAGELSRTLQPARLKKQFEICGIARALNLSRDLDLLRKTIAQLEPPHPSPRRNTHVHRSEDIRSAGRPDHDLENGTGSEEDARAESRGDLPGSRNRLDGIRSRKRSQISDRGVGSADRRAGGNPDRYPQGGRAPDRDRESATARTEADRRILDETGGSRGLRRLLDCLRQRKIKALISWTSDIASCRFHDGSELSHDGEHLYLTRGGEQARTVLDLLRSARQALDVEVDEDDAIESPDDIVPPDHLPSP